MSLQGLGTDMWRAEGRVKFNKKCQLKSARKRIKGDDDLGRLNGLSRQPAAVSQLGEESNAFNQHLSNFCM